MVLPSDDHVVLRQWLATRGVEASELAGILVTGDLDPLLAVAGSHRRLAPVDRQEVAEARAIARDNPEWPELNDLGAAACELRVSAVLEQVCEALGRAGVPAAPYQGLGVRLGPRAARGQGRHPRRAHPVRADGPGDAGRARVAGARPNLDRRGHRRQSRAAASSA